MKPVNEHEPKPLTERERTCLQWVAVGKTSWETGRIIGVAERTVNFHIQNACRKLGVHGRQAALHSQTFAEFAQREAMRDPVW